MAFALCTPKPRTQIIESAKHDQYRPTLQRAPRSRELASALHLRGRLELLDVSNLLELIGYHYQALPFPPHDFPDCLIAAHPDALIYAAMIQAEPTMD
jgi:hypothetical protein